MQGRIYAYMQRMRNGELSVGIKHNGRTIGKIKHNPRRLSIKSMVVTVDGEDLQLKIDSNGVEICAIVDGEG